MKLRITVDGKTYDVDVEVIDGAGDGAGGGTAITAPSPSTPTTGSARVTSPIAGGVFKLNVKVGDTVKRGQVLLILEAMKMESNIVSPADGSVTAIAVREGQSVKQGELLMSIG